jgi:hypothetical protein
MNRCREEGVDRWLDIEPPQLPIVVRSVDIVQVVHRSSLSTRPNRKYWNHAWCLVPTPSFSDPEVFGREQGT